MDEFFIKERDEYLNNISDSDSSSSCNLKHKFLNKKLK